MKLNTLFFEKDKFLFSIRFTLFFQLFCVSVFAQNNEAKNTSYPLQLNLGTGISFPTSVRKSGFDEAYSPGFHFLLSKKFNERNEIYSGFNINGIGVRKTAPYIKYESYYLSVPIMYRYEFVSNLFFETGLQQNLPFFSRFSKLNGDNASGRESQIEKAADKQLTFMNGGISLKMNELISIKALYSHPLSPKQNFSFKIDTSTYNYSFKNNQIQLLITYTIPQFEKPKNDKEIAKQLINELKNGVLLIVLPEKSILQDKLIKTSKINEANEISDKIMNLNKELMYNAKSNFNFCDILFIMPDKLEQIKNHNYSSCFLNSNLEIDNQFSIPAESKIMIAHLYLNENSVYRFCENKMNEIYVDYILIKDSEDFKVSYPFPYDITVNNITGNSKVDLAIIFKKLNDTLHSFYFKKNR